MGEPAIADVKPKLEPASPKDEKPTLSKLKVEPDSPSKKDIKSEEVKPLSDNKQEELLLKENALLRNIVAHQLKQIEEYEETIQTYSKSLQGNYWTVVTLGVRSEVFTGQLLPCKWNCSSFLFCTEGQTLPTSEQAVQTDEDVRTTGTCMIEII